jgi:NIMA (never in mitosis gene a)-related kinase
MAKLGDFNVSIVLNRGMMCETQTGTPYYASPEIWKDEPYDAKSDVWSLGCVLFEFIHLKPPFRARDMEGLSKKVNQAYFGKVSRYYSQDFTDILSLMLNPDPFARLTCSTPQLK